ncbi:hypothetical protein BN136_2789 [Cronobacter universalis NCTC 9529]|nr:hypothetical protein BN136_2789 [Cronobacter universalis NCTC 9529]
MIWGNRRLCAVRLCALNGKREALRSVGTHGKRPALLLPADNDVV